MRATSALLLALCATAALAGDEFYTELFTPTDPFDLDNTRVEFFPTRSPPGYLACKSSISALPVSTSGATMLSLGFEDYAPIVLSQSVEVLGQRDHVLFVASSGSVTFLAGDDESFEGIAQHYLLTRVSALFDNLHPGQGGSVSWQELPDRVVITWENVPERNEANTNTAQIEWFFDGRIAISWLTVDTEDALVGLSAGQGVPPAFVESSFSSLPECGPRPPLAAALSVATDPNSPITIQLSATDDGLPAPPASLAYVIESLPATGELIDPDTSTVITAIPHTLGSNGSAVIYSPFLNCASEDAFTYAADDGGTAPAAGLSEPVVVTVSTGAPRPVYEFLLDSNPGWTMTGSWGFGPPVGGGSANGDPFAGYTGANVLGNSLGPGADGNYPNLIPAAPNNHKITSPPLDCTGHTGVAVEFQRWLGIESAEFDHASFQVSSDGVNYTTVWEHTGDNLDDGAWIHQSFDISSIADDEPTVYLRWTLGPTDISQSHPGWNIDDIRVLADPPANHCPGDADGDDVVSFSDLNAILSSFGQSGAGASGDLDCDGAVSFTDLNAILVHFGSVCGGID